MLSISQEQKLSLGKFWKKVSKLRINQNNFENLLTKGSLTVQKICSKAVAWAGGFGFQKS